MQAWQLQEAKMRFSELVKKTISAGPQQITVHGKVTAVLISKDEYDRLTMPKSSLIEFLQSSPLAGVALDIKRNKSKTRKIIL